MSFDQFQVRAPGRVNLIGEHTDYNGLSVLPMALSKSVWISARPTRSPRVRLAAERLPGGPVAEFPLRAPIRFSRQGCWSNYVKAAAQGLLDQDIPLSSGIRGSVRGDLPMAAGLASSSALVVGTALALLWANRDALSHLVPTKAQLAEWMALAERTVGARGGGMDQTTCLLARKGHALRISFAAQPPLAEAVPIPSGWRWLVIDSGESARKSDGARRAFNARVRECRAALRRAAPAFETQSASGERVSYARIVRRALAQGSPEPLLRLAAPRLSEPLLMRFRHVVTEGARVALAQQALLNERISEFGALMNDSHRSLAKDFEASTPALDRIVRVALEAGAAGARLTGAGFGGCVVALCRDGSRLDEVRRAVARGGFGRNEGGGGLFEARPSEGAELISDQGDQPARPLFVTARS